MNRNEYREAVINQLVAMTSALQRIEMSFDSIAQNIQDVGRAIEEWRRINRNPSDAQ